jgi:hypothetical protein
LKEHDKRAAIDFTKLPNIEQMVWNFKKQDKGLNSLQKVSRFDLWRYNPKEKSYLGLELPPNIEHLDVNWANPPTLDGMQVFPELKEIQFHYCRNLTTIEALEKIAPNLEKIVVSRCKNMADFESIHNIKSLKYAFINNERVIS